MSIALQMEQFHPLYRVLAVNSTPNALALNRQFPNEIYCLDLR